MMLSVIVPIFNSEKYLKDCLDSILHQTYSNYEVILVNDGSTDNSQEIIDYYVNSDKRFHKFYQKNQGQSVARNKGICEAKGDYFLFVDSDDVVDRKLLEVINSYLEKDNGLDLIKCQIEKIDVDVSIVYENPVFSNLKGEDAFLQLIDTPMFVTPVSYVYKKDFWQDNNFVFAEGRIHEDFGLIPWVVVNANRVSSISYTGYYYFVRENSTMTDMSVEKLNRKNEDMIYHFQNLLSLVDNSNSIKLKVKDVFKSYIANAMIVRCILFRGDLLKQYVKLLKDLSIYSYLLDDTFFRRMKKFLFKHFPYVYISLFL